MTKRTCSIDGCEAPRRWGDLCNAHSVRLLRTGVRGGPIQRRGNKPPAPCSVGGCDSIAYCRRMCTRHYQQVMSRGMLNPPRISGEDHHHWQGDDVAYRTVHTRLQSSRGKASSYACVDCGNPALHWSYDHSSFDERVSTTGQPYSTDLDCYEPRCVRCHSVFDSQYSPQR